MPFYFTLHITTQPVNLIMLTNSNLSHTTTHLIPHSTTPIMRTYPKQPFCQSHGAPGGSLSAARRCVKNWVFPGLFALFVASPHPIYTTKTNPHFQSKYKWFHHPSLCQFTFIPLSYKQSNRSNSTQHFIISHPIDPNPTWNSHSYQFYTHNSIHKRVFSLKCICACLHNYFQHHKYHKTHHEPELTKTGSVTWRTTHNRQAVQGNPEKQGLHTWVAWRRMNCRQAVSGKIQKREENENTQVLLFHYGSDHIINR